MTWNSFTAWVETHRRHILDLIRIYLGVGLIIKGIFYLMNSTLIAPSVTPNWLTSIAPIVPYIHIVGGALLAVGLLTRLAAIVQMPIIFAALSFIHLPYMGQSMAAREDVEFSALVLFLLAVIALAGPGPFSLAERFGYKMDFAPKQFRTWSNAHPDLYLDAIRMYLGIGLFIKGLYIMNNQQEFGRLLENNNMPIGILSVAHYVIPAHLAGGAMLLLGFITRGAAMAQLPLLIGALFYVYMPRFASLELRQNIEFTALVLFLLSVLTVVGAGRYSVDHAVQRNYRLNHPEPTPLLS
ncbi:MAG TPA: DoxX family protein [Verrucomicrobiae bacterium]